MAGYQWMSWAGNRAGHKGHNNTEKNDRRASTYIGPLLEALEGHGNELDLVLVEVVLAVAVGLFRWHLGRFLAQRDDRYTDE